MEFFATAEHHVYAFTEWLTLFVELAGVLVVAWGVIASIWLYAGQIFTRKYFDFVALRLGLARYLIVALEFQLAADILATAIAPDWEDIGRLAAIAAIRTVLNYFLQLEIEEEKEELRSKQDDAFERRMEGKS